MIKIKYCGEKGPRRITIETNDYGGINIGVRENGFQTTTVSLDKQTFMMLIGSLSCIKDLLSSWIKEE